jgi:hypothetical protein
MNSRKLLFYLYQHHSLVVSGMQNKSDNLQMLDLLLMLCSKKIVRILILLSFILQAIFFHRLLKVSSINQP